MSGSYNVFSPAVGTGTRLRKASVAAELLARMTAEILEKHIESLPPEMRGYYDSLDPLPPEAEEVVCHVGAVGQVQGAPTAWVLPAAPVGYRWHRDDFTEAMLEGGKYRPLLMYEVGEYEYSEDGRLWREGSFPHVPAAGGAASWYRTRRPLPGYVMEGGAV